MKTNRNINSITRSAKLKLSCNLYSFNAPLSSGEMSLEQVIDYCADLGFDAVDPTGYYFPGYPTPPSERYLHAIARRTFRNGLGISGTGVSNNFASADPAKRADDIAHVMRWIEVASTLGAPCLRVFDGRCEPDDPAREQKIEWVVDGFRLCAAHGERHGVMIVYQNHNELLKTAAEVLDVQRRVASDWFGLNVDVGSLRTGDPYEEVVRLAPFACTWQVKELIYRNEREETIDLRRIVGILRDVGYRGYVPIETLGEGDPREKVRKFLNQVREAIGE